MHGQQNIKHKTTYRYKKDLKNHADITTNV